MKNIFRKEKWACFWISLVLFLGIFGVFIANEKPIYYQGNSPLLNHIRYQLGMGRYQEDFKISALQLKSGAVCTLIPYSTTTIDMNNSGAVGPFDTQDLPNLHFRHWLGTDELGRDVFSGIIYGCSTAILIGFGAVFIAFLFGIFVGTVSGYYGNKGFQMNVLSILVFILCTFIIYWISFELYLDFALIYGILGVFLTIYLIVNINKLPLRKYYIPLDIILMRIIEILHTIPSLLLIIIICGLIPKSGIGTIIMIIAWVSWGQFAKIARADVLKTKEADYIQYAKQAGISNFKIMLKHIIPNILTNSIQLMILSIPSAILAESILSFIGIGFGPDHVSWGSILAQSRVNMSAWWLYVFPTMFLVFTTLSMNRVGRYVGMK